MKKILLALVCVFVLSVSVYAQTAEGLFRDGLNAYFMGDLEKAQVNLQQAVSIDSSKYQYYFYLGRVQERMGYTEKAIEQYKTTTRLNGKYTPARMALANLYYEKNAYEEAIKEYQKLIDIDDKNYEAYYKMGLMNFNIYNYEEAEKNLKKAIEINETSAWANYYLGRVYIKQGKWFEAISEITKSIKQNPGVAEFYYWRANANYARGDYLADKDGFWTSVEDYRKAIELGFSSPQVYFMFGNTLLNRAIYYVNNNRENEGIESLKSAIVQYRRVITMDPAASNAFNNLGLSYFAMKKYDEALNSFKRAIELEPTVAFFHDNLGDAYYVIGQFRYAIEHWQLVLELEPDYKRYGLKLFKPEETVREKIQDARMRLY